MNAALFLLLVLAGGTLLAVGLYFTLDAYLKPGYLKAADSVVVVALVNTTDNTVVSYGSGFPVAEGYVATAAHVVNDTLLGGLEVWVIVPGVGDYKASIAYMGDPEGKSKPDLAVLTVPGLGLKPLRLALTVKEGQECYAIGYPWQQTAEYGSLYNVEPKITKGVVSDERSDSVVTDAEIDRGNSGGPLVDRSGAVVGIVSYALTSQEALANHNVAVHVDQLKNVLEAQGIRYRLAAPPTLTHSLLLVILAVLAGTLGALLATRRF